MAKKSSKQLDAEIAAFVAKPRRKAGARKKKKTPFEIQTQRFKTLQGIMADVYGDEAWEETDLDKIGGWIDVNDDLPDHEWFDTAKKQLEEQSVQPEHLGAPPPDVRAWNDAFISTYRMNIDDGMSEQDAIDSARQNANDSVPLHFNDRGLTKTDPKLYKTRW